MSVVSGGVPPSAPLLVSIFHDFFLEKTGFYLHVLVLVLYLNRTFWAQRKRSCTLMLPSSLCAVVRFYILLSADLHV